MKPLEASLIHDTEIFAKMDPYINFKCGAVTKRTKAHEGGGKKPKWNEVRLSEFILLIVFLV